MTIHHLTNVKKCKFKTERSRQKPRKSSDTDHKTALVSNLQDPCAKWRTVRKTDTFYVMRVCTVHISCDAIMYSNTCSRNIAQTGCEAYHLSKFALGVETQLYLVPIRFWDIRTNKTRILNATDFFQDLRNLYFRSTIVNHKLK